MSEFLKTNTVDIVCNGILYNSLEDFGLAISNTDYIGTPVQDISNLLYIPGRSGPLDCTESVFGEQYFKYRKIDIKFGSIRLTKDWDTTISEIRNLFEGRIVKLYFQTDPEWFYTGRVKIDSFEHKRQLGTFTFSIPYADPYKYRERTIVINAAASGTEVVLGNARKPTIPVITTDSEIKVQTGDNVVTFSAGTYRNTALRLSMGENSWNVTGNAEVTIKYTEGSL